MKREGHSLGDLGYVFVSQADPEIVVLVQQNLLLAGVAHTAGVIPGEPQRTAVENIRRPRAGCL